MNIYFTTGTYNFLKWIQQKHSEKTILLMQNNQHTLLLDETNGSTVFNTPRSYEVMESIGELVQEGFIAMNHTPIKEEGKPLFEYQNKNRTNLIASLPGIKAIRFLRPLKSDIYIFLTLWENEHSFQNWKSSKAYIDNPKNSVFDSTIFSMPPYVSTYFLSKEDQNK